MRVLIVACEGIARSVLEMLLSQGPGLEVVGKADNGQDLLAQVEASRPDVVLLDWEEFCRSQPEVLSVLRASDVQPRILVLGSRPEQRQAVLAAGAHGFASKGNSPKALLTAIRAIQLESQDV